MRKLLDYILAENCIVCNTELDILVNDTQDIIICKECKRRIKNLLYSNSTNTNANEEAISRKYILSFLDSEIKGDDDYSKGLNDQLKEIRKIVEKAPPTTTEQSSKIGRWVADRYCSECEWDKQEASYTSNWTENYCSNCGTKMKGVK